MNKARISSEETSVVLIEALNLEVNNIPSDDNEDLDVARDDGYERSKKDLTIKESVVEVGPLNRC